MLLRKIMGVFACALVIGAASFAFAGVPDLTLTTASMAYNATPDPLLLLNRPDGTGKAFNAAVLTTDGSIQDATISMTVLDGNGDPVLNFPALDMWLETTNGGLVPCSGGTAADQNSHNVTGFTLWAQPLLAGGADGGTGSGVVTTVYISGAPLVGSDMALWHNSPDINADGLVNVTDVQVFAVDYFAYAADTGDYEFKSDLEFDNAVNVSDIVPLAQGQGHNCP